MPISVSENFLTVIIFVASLQRFCHNALYFLVPRKDKRICLRRVHYSQC